MQLLQDGVIAALAAVGLATIVWFTVTALTHPRERVRSETAVIVPARGAAEALRLAELYGCTAAVLKERSPSCGCGRVYDGTFTGTLTEGDGVTAAELKARGIRVYGESEIEKVL